METYSEPLRLQFLLSASIQPAAGTRVVFDMEYLAKLVLLTRQDTIQMRALLYMQHVLHSCKLCSKLVTGYIDHE
jgi:hypothetical protein